MVAATARVPVLMPEAEKAELTKRAREANLSLGEFLRRAGKAYNPAEDDASLETMVELMNQATDRASSALDEAIAFIQASNERMAERGDPRVKEPAT